MTSNATYSRTITVDAPDFASKAVSFSLLTSVAIDAANNEVFPRKEYSLTLDGSGTGSISLPCPDNSGDAAWAWRVSLPDGRDVTTTLAYAATSLDLSDWLTAATTSETADAITALIESKADKVSGATADNLAGLDANGNLQDSGYGVIDEDGMASDSATDVPTQQSVKAYVDAQIGTVDDVSELTTTGLTAANMLRVAAAGGLEERTAAQVLSDIGAETAGAAATVQGNLDSHTGNTSNPHSVTAAQVGAYTSGETDTAIDTDIGTHAALTSSVHGISAFGATFVDDADAATARGTLGLGTMATEATGSYLAATGATTGATSQAQAFTNGIIGPTWKPASDSGSALQLQTSAGTAVITVDTSTPGVSINRFLNISGANAYANFSSTSGNLNVYYSRPAGSTAGFFMRTSGTNRWYMYTSNATESGSNAGSDFALAAYTDAGSILTDAFYVKRSTGNMTMVNKVAIGGYITPSAAQLTVDQQSATGAVPVLLLDQADDSEEMIEFTGTVGTGNAIEAVGAKTLTTTHFIKCTITGVGTVYIPVGTIA